jgi:ariadne-2
MSGTADSDDMDYSDDDNFEEYYREGDNVDIEQVDLSKTDPEYFEFKCLSTEEVERLLNECVEILCNKLQVWNNLFNYIKIPVLKYIQSSAFATEYHIELSSIF